MTISDPLESIRILKKANCPTLSGKSTLTYHLGRNGESEIQLRIHANDGGGFFSREWVAWKEIQHHLQKVPKDSPITSIVLHRLFKGKSVNTPAFLLAVLKHEKLIQPMKGKKRSHELVDPGAFLAKVNKLMSSNTGTPPKKTAKILGHWHGNDVLPLSPLGRRLVAGCGDCLLPISGEIIMNQLNTILDALKTVIAWELPDEYLEAAVNDQVGLMAGDDPENACWHHSDSPFSSQH